MRGLRQLGLFLSGLGVPVGAGWVGDSLMEVIRDTTAWPMGEPLYWPPAWYSWITSAKLCPLPPEAHVHILGAIGGIAVVILAVWFLHRNRNRLLSSDATPLPLSKAKDRTVLIIGLSSLADENVVSNTRAVFQSLPMQDIAASKAGISALAAQAKADGDDTRAQNLTVAGKTSWQQPFRLIWTLWAAERRRTPLRAILIVTSKGADPAAGDPKPMPGSETQVDAFIELLADRLRDAAGHGPDARPLPEIHKVTLDGIDFEEYTDVVAMLNQAVSQAERTFGVSHNRICVDITAGQKVFSVAAAMVTMNRRLIFSYVNNQGKTLFYDARINIGGESGEG